MYLYLTSYTCTTYTNNIIFVLTFNFAFLYFQIIIKIARFETRMVITCVCVTWSIYSAGRVWCSAASYYVSRGIMGSAASCYAKEIKRTLE